MIKIIFRDVLSCIVTNEMLSDIPALEIIMESKRQTETPAWGLVGA